MFETNEMFSLKGRTAIITGGLTGLGFAITRCMVGAGAKAVVLSREQPEKAVRFWKSLRVTRYFISSM